MELIVGFNLLPYYIIVYRHLNHDLCTFTFLAQMFILSYCDNHVEFHTITMSVILNITQHYSVVLVY